MINEGDTGQERKKGYQFMFRARMCRSLIFDRVGDWDQRTVHSCAKHKLITEKSIGMRESGRVTFTETLVI